MALNRPISRRQVLRGAGALAAFAALGPAARGRAIGPNEKLNIGVIGTANRAAANIEGVEGENIVAVCDIDTRPHRFKASAAVPQSREPSRTSAS